MINEKTIISSKNLFILYLVISSNFLANLFGCKIQKAFNENIYIKHLLGFFTLYLFISLVESSSIIGTGLIDKLKFAAIIYIWFILTTRMNIKFWIPFILMLTTIYILQLNIENENKNENPNTEKIEKYKNYQKILVKLSLLVTILGFLVYLGEKKYEYGNSFKFSTFISGVIKCKGDDFGGKSPISIIDSLKKSLL
jgi:hypothetical protein